MVLLRHHSSNTKAPTVQKAINPRYSELRRDAQHVVSSSSPYVRSRRGPPTRIVLREAVGARNFARGAEGAAGAYEKLVLN